MGKHLVFVGGGHAHMTALLQLGDYIKKGHEVTLISTHPYHYYSGMGPGLLSGTYLPQEVRFNVKKMAESRGARFVEGRVVKIEPGNKQLQLDSGGMEDYDVVSFNTGSEVPLDLLGTGGGNDHIFPVKPIENLLAARRIVIEYLGRGELSMAVIGAGPAGVEITANLWRLVRDHGGGAKITLIDGGNILDRFPKKVGSLAGKSLLRKEISIIEGDYVRSVAEETVTLARGGTLKCDLTFAAMGVTPSSLFVDSGLPAGDDGGLLVNRYLQSVAYPEIFGGGDCITLDGNPLARVGVHAVRQNPILYYNLMAALQEKPLIPFDPGGAYLLILNMGDGRGIIWKKNFVWEGKLAFILKDYIDRRFMRKFQVSGEIGEKG